MIWALDSRLKVLTVKLEQDCQYLRKSPDGWFLTKIPGSYLVSQSSRGEASDYCDLDFGDFGKSKYELHLPRERMGVNHTVRSIPYSCESHQSEIRLGLMLLPSFVCVEIALRWLFCELLTRIRHDKPLSEESITIRSMTFIGKIGCAKYGQGGE